MLVARLRKMRPDLDPKHLVQLSNDDDIVFTYTDVSGENISVDSTTSYALYPLTATWQSVGHVSRVIGGDCVVLDARLSKNRSSGESRLAI